jgi:hypothetical protein
MPRGRPRKSQDSMLIKSAELVGWAIGGLEREIEETRAKLTSLNAQVAKLRARAGKRVSAATAAAAASVDRAAAAVRKRRRSTMSPEARKRMSEMLRKRWAERKKKGLKAL